jgi:glucokinase
LILAGDIGATKTALALVDGEPVHQARFESRDYESFDRIVAEFLGEARYEPERACFGVAGPVSDRKCRTTNLPWLVDADRIEREFGIPRVKLINDLVAVATAVPHLREHELAVLQDGERDPHGAIGIVAPGTGLGQASLTWTGEGYRAWPSEGGHSSFAPNSSQQVALLAFLSERYGHVSDERACSGSAVPDLYEFLAGRPADEPAPAILGARTPESIAVLDLFVGILGGIAGDMALRMLATGGLYLGGGIPPRILDRLKQPDFLDAFRAKGRFHDWLARIPVAVILDPDAALRGAALAGLVPDR